MRRYFQYQALAFVPIVVSVAPSTMASVVQADTRYTRGWQYQAYAEPIVPKIPLPQLPFSTAYIPSRVFRPLNVGASLFLDPKPIPGSTYTGPFAPSVPSWLPSRLPAVSERFVSIYTAGVMPLKPPDGGGLGIIGDPPPPPPDFVILSAATVPAPVGRLPYAYVVRGDSNQIALLDTRSSSAVDFAVLQTHPFTGEDRHRSLRKKLVRILVYGEGHIPSIPNSAYMVVTADKSRSDVYVYSAQSPDPAQNMLWSQNALALIGRTFDLTLFLTGSGIIIREIELQYTVVG
jgi:hypothetical protein